MDGNSRLGAAAAVLPAATVLALFVGIMTGQTWAILPVATIAGVVALIGAAAAKIPARAVAHFDAGFDKASVVRHEKGHMRVARKLGCSPSVEYRYDPKTDNWSGSVYLGFFDPSLEPWQYAAIAKGGEVAAGNDIGCGFDKSLFDREIKRYPRRERDGYAQKANDFANRNAR